MRYLVEGRLGKKKQKLLDNVMDFVINFVDLPDRVRVVVIPTRQRHRVGACVSHSRLFFEMELSVLLPDDQFVRTIIHEMKHVEQYATGVLSFDRWEDQPVEMFRDAKYIDLPWEKEAYEFEDQIYDQWSRRPV